MGCAFEQPQEAVASKAAPPLQDAASKAAAPLQAANSTPTDAAASEATAKDAPPPTPPPSRAAVKRLQRTVVAVREQTVEGAPMEVSAHEMASPVAIFVPHVFPDAQGMKKLRVVVTVQKAAIDIMDINATTEAERCRLYGVFARFAAGLAERLPSGAFFDHGDMDGTPARTSMGGSSFNEVEVAHSALGYRLVTIGGVSIIDHPRLGRSIYLGSVVTSATADEVRAALSSC